jgi:hypothetical protein
VPVCGQKGLSLRAVLSHLQFYPEDEESKNRKAAISNAKKKDEIVILENVFQQTSCSSHINTGDILFRKHCILKIRCVIHVSVNRRVFLLYDVIN